MPEFLQNANEPVWMAALLVATAVIFIGIGKSGFGGGVGMVSPPLMAQALPVTLVVPAMLPLLIACDVVAIVQWWRRWHWRSFLLLLPGTVVGVAAGTLLLGRLDETHLRVGLGAICVLFVGVQVVRLRGGLSTEGWRPVWWHGTVAGLVAGFCSTLAHAAGPVVALFLMPQRHDKGTFVATTALYFTFLNWIKVPSYVLSGYLDVRALTAAAWMFPLVPLGGLLGLWLHRRIPEKPFIVLIYVIALASGIKLILGS